MIEQLGLSETTISMKLMFKPNNVWGKWLAAMIFECIDALIADLGSAIDKYFMAYPKSL